MSYIDRSDVLKVIGVDQLGQLEDGYPTLIADLAPTAESYIANHIKDRYQLEVEFALTGFDRDPQLVLLSASIVAFYAYRQVASDQMPEITNTAYHEAIRTLEKVQRGKMYFDSIPRTDSTAGRTMRFGGDDEESSFNNSNY